MPGTAPRAGDPPPSSVAALLSSAPSSTIARYSRSRSASGNASESRIAPVAWTCIANPSAVEPSTAPSASSTSAASAIDAPSPPAASGTHSRCRPAADDRRRRARLERVARGRGHEAARGRVLERRRDRRASRVCATSASARPCGRPAESAMSASSRARSWSRLLRARDPVRDRSRYDGGRASQSAQAAVVRPEPRLLVGAERGDRPLVRVDRGLRRRRAPRTRRVPAGRIRPSLGQRRDLGHVDRAPVAALPARREPLDVS